MLALVFSQLIEVQAEYHRKSLTLLQAVLPQIKAQQGNPSCYPPWSGKVGDSLPAFPDATDAPCFHPPLCVPRGHICMSSLDFTGWCLDSAAVKQSPLKHTVPWGDELGEACVCTDVYASVGYTKPSNSGHSRLASALCRPLSPPKTMGMETPLGLHVFHSLRIICMTWHTPAWVTFITLSINSLLAPPDQRPGWRSLPLGSPWRNTSRSAAGRSPSLSRHVWPCCWSAGCRRRWVWDVCHDAAGVRDARGGGSEGFVMMPLECRMQEEVGLGIARPHPEQGPEQVSSSMRHRPQDLHPCYHPHCGPYKSKHGKMEYSLLSCRTQMGPAFSYEPSLYGETGTTGHDKLRATLWPFFLQV